jgi:hypothetical protein
MHARESRVLLAAVRIADVPYPSSPGSFPDDHRFDGVEVNGLDEVMLKSCGA